MYVEEIVIIRSSRDPPMEAVEPVFCSSKVSSKFVCKEVNFEMVRGRNHCNPSYGLFERSK